MDVPLFSCTRMRKTGPHPTSAGHPLRVRPSPAKSETSSTNSLRVIWYPSFLSRQLAIFLPSRASLSVNNPCGPFPCISPLLFPPSIPTEDVANLDLFPPSPGHPWVAVPIPPKFSVGTYSLFSLPPLASRIQVTMSECFCFPIPGWCPTRD